MSEANGPKKRKMSLEKRHNLTGWAFLAPATIMIAIMSFWPMIQALILSFQTGKANNLEFGGLTNYIRMFKDKVFMTSLGNTFLYLIIQVPIMLVLALMLAQMLNNKDLARASSVRRFSFPVQHHWFLMLLSSVLCSEWMGLSILF